MKTRVLVPAALVLAGVGTAAAAPPARAECVEVTLEVHREGRPHWYPLGGPAHCVTDTPWNQGQDVTWGAGQEGLPPCTPKGFWLQVWTTGP